MTGTFDDGRAYHAYLRSLSPPETEIQPLELMLGEFRGCGWTGSAHVRPQVAGTTNSLQAVLGTGLTPGSACVVHLAEAGSTSTVRTWPSIVTSVNVKESTTGSTHQAPPFSVIAFCDLLTALSNRPVWFAWSAAHSDEDHADGRTVLAEIIGGALSAAAGEDPYPSSTPTLPAGYPIVSIDADVDDAVVSPAYVIATGQPFGAWVEQLCGHLGVRIEMIGLPSGDLRIHLTDKPPAQSRLNHSGPVSINADSTSPPSSGNIQLSRFCVTPFSHVRGGVLDNPKGGGPMYFGASGAVGSVISDARLDAEEAERRSGFGTESDELESFRIAGLSSKPELTIGRLVSISGPDLASEDIEIDGQPGALNLDGEQWQVASVVHLYMKGSYWNRPEFEKAELAWRPRWRSVPKSVVVSGWVDDGESDPGQPVSRDELGRLPVRLVFSQPVSQFSSESAATSYYPALKLSPVSLSAGDSHGYVTDHRQQDWCRVQVHTPLLAEVIGFVYRDDRSIKQPVRDITAGMLVRQGADTWRGWIFRPSSANEDDTAQTEDDTAQTEDDISQTWRKPGKPFPIPNRGPLRKSDPTLTPNGEPIRNTDPTPIPNRGRLRKPDPTLTPNGEPIRNTDPTPIPNRGRLRKPGPTLTPNVGSIRKPGPTLTPNVGSIRKTDPTPIPNVGSIRKTDPTPIPNVGPIRKTDPTPMPSRGSHRKTDPATDPGSPDRSANKPTDRNQ